MDSQLKSGALTALLEKIGPKLVDELAQHYIDKVSEKEYNLVVGIKNVHDLIRDFNYKPATSLDDGMEKEKNF